MAANATLLGSLLHNATTALVQANLSSHADHDDHADDHLHHHQDLHQDAAAHLVQPTTQSPQPAATGGQQQVLLLQSIMGDQVTQTKLVASLVLFIITLLCGYLPVRCILNQNYIQYAMFAGGGVLMATAFCHLIPETHDSYRLAMMGPNELAHNHQGHNHAHAHQATNGSAGEPLPTPSALSLPYPEITLCCGFFFMYLVEQLMIRFINNHTHEHPCDTSMGQLVVPVSVRSSNNNGVGVGGDRCNSDDLGASSQANLNLAGSSSALGGSIAGSGSGGKATEFYKFLRGLLIVSAFMAHSIFDGVAIGSQVTIEKVWTIFLAISCHKLIIAAVVGLELYAATLESHLWTLVHLSIFSIMSPIGIVLVVVAQNSLHIDANSPTMIMLQSFATGTLLYIVFVEILQPKEGQAYEKNRIGKSISLIGGFAVMLLVLTLIGEG